MKTAPTSLHVSAPKYTAPREGIRPEDHDDVISFRDSLQRKSPKTRTTYVESAEAFARFTASKGMPLLEHVEREHLEMWFDSLHARGNAPTTIRTRQAAMRSLYKWMLENGLRKTFPMERVKLEHLPEKIEADYKADEITAVLAAIKGNDLLALRDRAVMLFLYDTGLRSAELCSLRIGSLDRDGRRATVTGKGGKERIVGYGLTTASAVFKYVRRRGGFELLGPKASLFVRRGGEPMTSNGLRAFLGRRFAAADVPFFGVHGFRRAFAITYLNNGGDALALKQLAGWKGLQMVYRYVRASEQERALRSYDDFSPVDRMTGKS